MRLFFFETTESTSRDEIDELCSETRGSVLIFSELLPDWGEKISANGFKVWFSNTKLLGSVRIGVNKLAGKE